MKCTGMHVVFDAIILEGIATVAAHRIATDFNFQQQKTGYVVTSIDLTNKIDGFGWKTGGVRRVETVDPRSSAFPLHSMQREYFRNNRVEVVQAGSINSNQSYALVGPWLCELAHRPA